MTDTAPGEALAPPSLSALAAVFPGDGEIARRCRAFDWARTPLGPVETWPQSLRTAVDLCLGAAVPSYLWWGAELIQLYNDAALAIVRAKHPAALGAPARDAWAEVWPVVGPLLEGVLATGEGMRGDDVPMEPDRGGPGTSRETAWFTFSYGAVRDERGRVAGVFCTALETTGRVRAEAATRESEGKFRGLFESMIEAYCVIEMIFDDGGRPVDFLYVETNPAFDGQATMPMLGRRIRDLVPDFEQFWIDQYGHVALTGEPVRLEHVVAGLGDQWFHTSAFRIGGDESRRVGVLFENITARKRAEAARERLLDDARAARAEAERARAEADEARRAAEASNRAKSEFLAIMSHELRTPLNAIGGYAELIELGIHGPLTAEQRTALARIQSSQRHLLGLIAGVLDYSRVEAGAVSYRIADVPVTEAVAEAEALVAPQLRAKGLGYAWSGAPPGLRVRADREKLQQILLNLLGNAVKFTYADDGEPGRIEVRCVVDDAAAAGSAGHVRLEVRDTGQGIAAEALERIFEPFVQADQRLTRPHAGVGLGLAISRDLARGMGGDLTVQSVDGEGSTFALTLPRA